MSVETAPLSALSRDAALALYRQMLLIRLFETRAGELCRQGEMPAFLHLYVGEEATGVGVCSRLDSRDRVTSTHRGHGHALAMGCSPNRLMAELYGKAGGLCGGRGGSMHLFDAEHGLMGTNGFVGGGIPAAVGAGFAAKHLKTGGVAVAFFGDGAINHGAFHEALNLAANYRLPVLFVCENNLYATATPLDSVTANPDVASRAAAYALPGFAVDGQDIFAVWEAAGTAVRRARAGEGPTLLECKTYRYVGHHEGDPVTGTYRSAAEVEEWRKRDPLHLMESRLTADYQAEREEIDALRAEVAAQVETAVEFARNSPFPAPETLENYLFCEAAQ